MLNGSGTRRIARRKLVESRLVQDVNVDAPPAVQAIQPLSREAVPVPGQPVAIEVHRRAAFGPDVALGDAQEKVQQMIFAKLLRILQVVLPEVFA